MIRHSQHPTMQKVHTWCCLAVVDHQAILAVITAWISNYIHCKVWDGIIYSLLNFNGSDAEFWEWISNFIPHFTGRDYLSMLELKSIHLS